MNSKRRKLPMIHATRNNTVFEGRFVGSHSGVEKGLNRRFYWQSIPNTIRIKKIVEFERSKRAMSGAVDLRNLAEPAASCNIPFIFEKDFWALKKLSEQIIVATAKDQNRNLFLLDELLNNPDAVEFRYSIITLNAEIERPKLSTISPKQMILSMFYANELILDLHNNDQQIPLRPQLDSFGVYLGDLLVANANKHARLEWSSNISFGNAKYEKTVFFYNVYKKL